MNRKAEGKLGTAALEELLDKRSPFLARLAERAADQRQLREELDLSRSTVYKALVELSEAGLVADGDDGYELTGFGRFAWHRYADYRARLDRLGDARPLLDALPDDHPVPLAVFERGRILVPGRHAPDRPLDRMEELAEAADHLRCFSPAGMPRYLSDIHERVEDGEQSAVLVVEADAVERLKSGYDHFETAAENPDLEIRSVDGELPFAVVLFDERMLGLFVYEGGVLVGATFSDDAGVIQWAESLFDRKCEFSNPV